MCSLYSMIPFNIVELLFQVHAFIVYLAFVHHPFFACSSFVLRTFIILFHVYIVRFCPSFKHSLFVHRTFKCLFYVSICVGQKQNGNLLWPLLYLKWCDPCNIVPISLTLLLVSYVTNYSQNNFDVISVDLPMSLCPRQNQILLKSFAFYRKTKESSSHKKQGTSGTHMSMTVSKLSFM